MDEQDAIRRCQGGDRDAFTVLVERYQAVVIALCLRMTGNRADALDVSQQAFVKAYGNLDRFDPDLPFRPWLLKIATNECIAHLRRQRRQPVPVEQEALEQAAGIDESPGALHELLSDREQVRQAVAGLPEHYRHIVVRHYFQEQSYQVIAREMEIPMGTVATHLYRAKQLLKSILTAKEGIPRGTSDARAAASVPGR